MATYPRGCHSGEGEGLHLVAVALWRLPSRGCLPACCSRLAEQGLGIHDLLGPFRFYGSVDPLSCWLPGSLPALSCCRRACQLPFQWGRFVLCSAAWSSATGTGVVTGVVPSVLSGLRKSFCCGLTRPGRVRQAEFRPSRSRSEQGPQFVDRGGLWLAFGNWGEQESRRLPQRVPLTARLFLALQPTELGVHLQ